MGTESKHTPGPYEAQGRAVIAEGAENPCCILQATDGNDHPDPRYHANLSDDTQEANAAFAARACNCHDDLLAALEQIGAMIDDDVRIRSDCAEELLSIIDPAIAKAEVTKC